MEANINKNKPVHAFHIPVMGTSFTIDTPIRVAHYGISSVISIIDHRLTEDMRKFHCDQTGRPYEAIPERSDDSRAKRITAYLNLVNDLVRENFKKVKESFFEAGSEIVKYFEMLPDFSALKREYHQMLENGKAEMESFQERLRAHMRPGSIDVNIMTKIDSANLQRDKTPLPVEFNDAHAALRGFARSDLNASIVFSAGMNPRLYGYIAQFDDFFPDENGEIKKKIILKVSDYRSALIQGKFLAKKGLWVSEFRIESGLNCGGHAFATDGYLLGPILEVFKNDREKLTAELFAIYNKGLEACNRRPVSEAPEVLITVQGGVGNAEEQTFLLEHYEMDSVGWGTPFLLVPEAVNIDEKTMDLLSHAGEKDLYLSHVSPLGVPFNTVRNNSADIEKYERVEANRPGAPCVKRYLISNKEFSTEPICTASREYQNKKLKELEAQNLPEYEFKKAFEKMVEKVCLCVGLGNAAAWRNGLPISRNGTRGVAVCPGPNMAYFSKVVSLKEMVDHIYGRINLTTGRADRPHMFIKELRLYIDYLKEKMEESADRFSESQAKYFQTFQENLHAGIAYYRELFANTKTPFEEMKSTIMTDLERLREELNHLVLQPA